MCTRPSGAQLRGRGLPTAAAPLPCGLTVPGAQQATTGRDLWGLAHLVPQPPGGRGCARARRGGESGPHRPGTCRSWSGVKSGRAGPSPVPAEMCSSGGAWWGLGARELTWAPKLKGDPLLSCWDKLSPGSGNRSSHQCLAPETCSLTRLRGSPRIHPDTACPLLATLGVRRGGKPLSRSLAVVPFLCSSSCDT